MVRLRLIIQRCGPGRNRNAIVLPRPLGCAQPGLWRRHFVLADGTGRHGRSTWCMRHPWGATTGPRHPCVAARVYSRRALRRGVSSFTGRAVALRVESCGLGLFGLPSVRRPAAAGHQSWLICTWCHQRRRRRRGAPARTACIRRSRRVDRVLASILRKESKGCSAWTWLSGGIRLWRTTSVAFPKPR